MTFGDWETGGPAGGNATAPRVPTYIRALPETPTDSEKPPIDSGKSICGLPESAGKSDLREFPSGGAASAGFTPAAPLRRTRTPGAQPEPVAEGASFHRGWMGLPDSPLALRLRRETGLATRLPLLGGEDRGEGGFASRSAIFLRFVGVKVARTHPHPLPGEREPPASVRLFHLPA